jgi:hypothetical protein
MECQNNSIRYYCYSCSICFENCSLFGLILFIDCKHFSICFIFFKQRKRVSLLKKNYANNLQKQRIAEEIKRYYFYIYCALCANLKFNFKVLFAFTKIIKYYYLKHFIQNSIKKCAFSFPHFYTKSRS